MLSRYLKYIIAIIVAFSFIASGFAFAADRHEAERLTVKGLKALKDSKLTVARNLLARAIREDPTYDRAHSAMGDYLSLDGKYDKAVSEYSKAIELDGDSKALTFKIGKARYRNEEYRKAVIHFKKLREVYQNNMELFYLMGDSYRRLNNFKKAEASLNRVLLQMPNSVKARLALGRLYMDNEMYGKARGHFVIIRDHADVDDLTREEMKSLIIKVDNMKQRIGPWHLAIPVVVILVIIPLYLFLKKRKKEHPDEPEEEFDG